MDQNEISKNRNTFHIVCDSKKRRDEMNYKNDPYYFVEEKCFGIEFIANENAK